MRRAIVAGLIVAAWIMVGMAGSADAQCCSKVSEEKSVDGSGCGQAESSASSASSAKSNSGRVGCGTSTTPGCPHMQAVRCSGKMGDVGETPERVNLKELGLLERAEHEGSFGTLVAALKAAELTEALAGKGPFTLFAPSDEAFAKLPPGTLESLLADKQRLAAVLSYHVVPGELMAEDIAKVEAAGTLHGQELQISADEKGVQLDEARVVARDILCKNGVIHVIDRVLLPGERS